MRGVDDRQDRMFSYISLEARVPENHPLRPIRTMFDEALAKLTAKFDTMYADGELDVVLGVDLVLGREPAIKHRVNQEVRVN